MHFAGLSLAQLLSLLAAASAITIALYMLKQRRRQVRVPFLPLWEGLLRDSESNRLFQNLKRLLSLLLALLVVGMLVLAAGDPRRDVGSTSSRHTVVLIDAGLTMRASDVAPTRLDEARRRARALVQDAAPGHRFLLAQMDATTAPLSPMTAEPHVLSEALSRLTQTPLTTAPESAYSFALHVLRGLTGANIVVYSDGEMRPSEATERALQRAGIALQVERIGKDSPNVALSAFAARRYPLDRNRSELLVEVRNASSSSKKVRLTLLGDGRAIDVQSFDVDGGQRTRRIYDDITGVSSTLEAQVDVIGGEDELGADDRAYAAMPERERVRVLCVSDGNRFLEAALLLDEYLDVDVAAPGSYEGAGDHDFAIFDRYVPPQPPGVPALYLRPEGAAWGPFEVAGEVERPFVQRLQRKHPLLAFTALSDINIGRALKLQAQPEDEVLAGSSATPLIVSGQRAGQPFLALAFDVRESDLPLRVAWPLLVLNAIDRFTGADSGYISSYEVGQPLQLDLPPGTEVTLIDPAGAEQRLPVGSEGLLLTPQQTGFYKLTSGVEHRVLAVNLPADARAELAPPAEDVAAARARAPSPPRASQRSALSQPPWILLLLAALLLLIIEWTTYHRRWTV